MNSNLDELGNEYARLVLAQEHGIDCDGNGLESWQRRTGDRQLEIEEIFNEAQDYTLDQFVENLFQAMGIWK